MTAFVVVRISCRRLLRQESIDLAVWYAIEQTDLRVAIAVLLRMSVREIYTAALDDAQPLNVIALSEPGAHPTPELCVLMATHGYRREVIHIEWHTAQVKSLRQGGAYSILDHRLSEILSTCERILPEYLSRAFTLPRPPRPRCGRAATRPVESTDSAAKW